MSSNTMKAAVFTRYGSPDVLNIETVPLPTAGPGGVLVRNHAASVTAADNAALSGSPFAARLYFGLTRPKWTILGGDFAGEVVAVGDGVTRFAAGDRVFGTTGVSFAGHAEYVSLPEDGVISSTPGNISDAGAVAIVGGHLTSLPFLRDAAGLRAGQTILINGASGSVGIAAVQLAKHFGAHVTAVCSTANLELVMEQGADVAIDYTASDFTRSAGEFDVVFDAVGKSSFLRCRRLLKRGGIYLTTVPTLAILIQMAWTSRFGHKRAGIAFTGLSKPEAIAIDLEEVARLAEAGAVRPVIHKAYPLEGIADAFRLVATGRKRGNVVIAMGESTT